MPPRNASTAWALPAAVLLLLGGYFAPSVALVALQQPEGAAARAERDRSELAAAARAYAVEERPYKRRGDKFYELTWALDSFRGRLTESEILSHLGPPERMTTLEDGSLVLGYRYDYPQSPYKVWEARPVLRDRVLLHFAYNPVDDELVGWQPYPRPVAPPATQPQGY